MFTTLEADRLTEDQTTDSVAGVRLTLWHMLIERNRVDCQHLL